MCVNISATVALFCLFAPKVYIVLLQPHKNVRQTSAASLSTANKTARTFYDAARSSMSGGPSTTAAAVAAAAGSTSGHCIRSTSPPTSWSPYGDLNGGVYCGEVTTFKTPGPDLSRDRKSRSSLVTSSTTATTEVSKVDMTSYQNQQYFEVKPDDDGDDEMDRIDDLLEEDEDDPEEERVVEGQEERDFLGGFHNDIDDVIMEEINGSVKEKLMPQVKDMINFAKLNHAGLNDIEEYDESSCDETSPVKILTPEIT